MPEPLYALSVKQPWAALIVHGLKTIEIRRWRTPRRGIILIHASRISDARPESWLALPESIRPGSELRGGIIGVAHLAGCVTYEGRSAFVADRRRHLNPPRWFRPCLYGFLLRKARPLQFRPMPGAVRFFPVELPPGYLRRKLRPSAKQLALKF